MIIPDITKTSSNNITSAIIILHLFNEMLIDFCEVNTLFFVCLLFYLVGKGEASRKRCAREDKPDGLRAIRVIVYSFGEEKRRSEIRLRSQVCRFYDT